MVEKEELGVGSGKSVKEIKVYCQCREGVKKQ